MKEFTHDGEELTLVLGQYAQNGNLSVSAVAADGAPVATLSVNMPPYLALPEGVFYLKTWSENTFIAADLIDSGLIERAYEVFDAESGYVRASAYRFRKED